MAELNYVAPPQEPTARRVYILPVSLVKRIHEYGYQNGHQSEVSAIKALLESALAERGA